MARKVRQLHNFFTNSLQQSKKKLAKECKCQTSQKVRVSSDYSTSCQGCEQPVIVASKKRVIKNRNDPQFWGLKVKEKVLCGNCLEQKKGNMLPLRRTKFKEYRKLGRI